MSAKSSPKIVRLDLQLRVSPKKPRKKIQAPKNKYSSPQLSQKTFNFTNQQSAPQLKNSALVQSKVQAYQSNQFSFSQQSPSRTSKLEGPGYQIYWIEDPRTNNNKYDKFNYMHVNMTVKIFELCTKDYENERIMYCDMEVFSKNLTKHLKAIYGAKNQHLTIKKQSRITECLKMIFYRKRQIEASELLFYLIDCGAIDQMLQCFLQIYPREIKAF